MASREPRLRALRGVSTITVAGHSIVVVPKTHRAFVAEHDATIKNLTGFRGVPFTDADHDALVAEIRTIAADVEGVERVTLVGLQPMNGAVCAIVAADVAPEHQRGMVLGTMATKLLRRLGRTRHDAGLTPVTRVLTGTAWRPPAVD